MKGKIIDSNMAETLVSFEDFSTLNLPTNKLPSNSQLGDKVNIGSATSCSSSRSRFIDFF